MIKLLLAVALCLTTSLAGADELSVNVPAPAFEPFTVPSPIPIQISYPEAYYPPYIVVPPPTPYDAPFVVTRPIYGYSYWRAPWSSYSYDRPFIPYYRPPYGYPPRFGYRWRWR